MRDPEWTVTNLISTAIAQYPGGLRSIHEGILPDRAYSTLAGDVNPGNKLSRLKVGDMINIIQATGDHEALRYLASLFGYRLVCSEGNDPDAPTMFEEFTQDYSATVRFHETGRDYQEKKATFQQLLSTRDAAHAEIDQSFSRTVGGDVKEGHVMRGGKWVNLEARQ